MLPPEPGLYFANYSYFYNGTFGGQRQLPIGGVLAAGVRAFAFADIPTFIYVAPTQVAGAQLAAIAGVPLVYGNNAARVTALGRSVRVAETNFNLGDVYVAPIVLGWTAGNHHVMATAGIYAPTGEFQLGSIAPTGKNFWTVEPTLAYTYLNPKSGCEFSWGFTYDFNSENEPTDYKSGQSAHLDWLVAKHFSRKLALPLPPAGGPAKGAAEPKGEGEAGKGPEGGGEGKGGPEAPAPPAPEGKAAAGPPAIPPIRLPTGIAAGVAGFFYQQVTGDSGPGARLGPFEGRTYGIGPALQAVVPIAGKDVALQIKVYQEFNVQNRPQGGSAYFNASFEL